MKRLNFFLLVMLCWQPITAHCQLMAEWFNQKKTQIKYLGQQIAELQIYLGYIKRGYKIVSGGLNTIHDIKNGEFKLHDLYYKSLELVNPRIRNSPKAKGIISHQLYILRACNEIKDLLKVDNPLPASLKTYINETTSRLMDGVEKVRGDLEAITTDNAVKMKDSERLERLDALYQNSKSQFVFAQKFSSEVVTLIHSIQQEKRDTQILKELHGLQ